MVKFIKSYQKKLIRKGVYWSSAIHNCKIVLGNQHEGHLQLYFFNYPKFPQKHEVLKAEIQGLRKVVML